jgi:hypothetical protein
LENSIFVLRDRRGVSKAVKVVLILLLVVASMAILFIGIKTILKYNEDNIVTPSYNADLKISQVQMMDYNDVGIKVKSILYDDKLQGVNFIVYDREGSEMGRYQAPISELKENNYQVVLSVDNTSNIRTVVIAPVTLSNSGQEVVGTAADQYKITGTGTVFTPIPEDTGYAQEAVVYCTSASQCKDSDPCTTGACSKGLCSYPKIPGCEFCEDNSQCDDNNSCTDNVCDGERCTYPIIEGCQSCAYNFQCEDNNACTADSCVENGCAFSAITNCTSCTLDVDCEDYNLCTTNTCTNGRCSYPVIANCKVCNMSSQCSDNSICTNDTCVDGGCVHSPIDNCSSCTLDVDCNDNNGCTNDKCSSEGKCTYSPMQNCKSCTSASQCNDNNPCTNEGCLKGACTYSATNTCKTCTLSSQCVDTNPCTNDTCTNGICLNLKITNCTYCTSVLQCEDNNPCTIHSCSENICTYTQMSNCSICTLNSQCNDNNINTTDACIENKCVYSQQEVTPSCTLNSQCSDNDSCTTDSCVLGTCSRTTVTSCISNDGCCPIGCNSSTDSNCPVVAVCGNGIRDGTEKCEGTNVGGATCAGVMGSGYTGTLKCYAAGTANACKFDTSLCVAPCTCASDNNICTTDICQDNSCQHIKIGNCCTSVSQCTSGVKCTSSVCSGNRCAYPIITTCKSNDGCCPTGCNALNDNDCASVCGNGIKEGTEKCDDGDKSSGDGCSSSCTVESGYSCNTASPNVCTKTCVSNCDGKECGSDGCTGSCGSCANAHGTTSCSAGVCKPVCSSGYTNCDGDRTNGCETCESYCGDGDCNSDEDCDSCSEDCGSCESYCGDGDCNSDEDCDSCSEDCGTCINPPTGGAIVINHLNTDITKIPDTCLTKAKQLTIQYAHTSYGDQILQGLPYVRSLNSKYTYDISNDGLPSGTNILRIFDGTATGMTYITPEDYWASSSGISKTKTVASTGDYDISMWTWCGQMGDSSYDMNDYASTIKGFESQFSNMRFILATGHTMGVDLQDSSETYTSNLMEVRAYAEANNMVLYDYSDIESYDPSGKYYRYMNGYDQCTWCDSWCNSHSSECQDMEDEIPSCSHSQAPVCAQKAKAFWWMMARLAGWDGIAGHGC